MIGYNINILDSLTIVQNYKNIINDLVLSKIINKINNIEFINKEDRPDNVLVNKITIPLITMLKDLNVWEEKYRDSIKETYNKLSDNEKNEAMLSYIKDLTTLNNDNAYLILDDESEKYIFKMISRYMNP